MKTLDSKSLHNGIEELQKKIQSQIEQLKKLESTIGNFSNLDDSFNGKGGKAIRAFYKEWHLPILSFHYYSLKNFNRVLTNLKKATEDLESDSNGFIRQSFLEGELTNGVKKIKSITTELVDETNNAIDLVSDIVSVQRLNDQQFHSHIQRANKEIDQTIEDLGNFDRNQTKELDSVEQDIQLMKSYISEIQAMFRSGELSVENYTKGQLNNSFFQNNLQESLKEKEYLFSFLKSLTVRSEYEGMNQLFMRNSDGTSTLFTNRMKSLSLSGGDTAQSKNVLSVGNSDENKFTFEKNIIDGFNSDGVGNASASFSNNKDIGIGSMGLSGSIVNTEKMDDIPDFLEQKVLYGESNVRVPYAQESIKESLLYGQNIGLKTEAVVSKTTFSGDSSPLATDFIFGQAEAKANYENYTLAAGAGVSAAKVELKLEPLNFFGYEPLEEWFGFEYDPFVGLDISLGSIGVSGSVGLENSIYAAYGIGVGVKAGLEEDK